MQAHRITAPRKGVVVNEVKPVPGPDEVLIRVCYSGICGSDLHAYEGRHARRKIPLVSGHELCGEVEDAGRNVSGFAPGAPVTVLPERACGACDMCARGRTNLCPSKVLMGTAAWPGGFAEYVCAPASHVLALPESMPLKLGALAEPVAVAVHASRQAGVREGDNILVMGAGGIGSLILAVNKLRGVGLTVVTDLKEFNLGKARDLRADLALNTTQKSAPELLAGYPDLPRADVAFIAASHYDLINQCFSLVRRGGVIALVGQFNTPGVIDIEKGRVQEQTVVSSTCYLRDDFEEAIRLLAAHPETFLPLITREISLAEVEPTLLAMAEGKLDVVKVLINMTGADA